jgi:hypothetical protein
MKAKRMILGVSSDRITELRQIPAVVHLRELMAKVRSGTATAAERDEYEARTKRARELDPSVLVD